MFFDVLHLDGTPMLDKTYDERRRTLEGAIRTIPGFVSGVHAVNCVVGLTVSVNSGGSCACTAVERHDRGEECEFRLTSVPEYASFPSILTS